MSHHSDYNEQNEDSGDLTFAKFLKHNCQTTHDSVDNLVMSVKPFDSTDNYIKFLQLQAVFHKVVDREQKLWAGYIVRKALMWVLHFCLKMHKINWA